MRTKSLTWRSALCLAALAFAPGAHALRAGVGVADMTPDVGYCSGQYCDSTDILDGIGGGEIDPHADAKTKLKSYGVQSRLTARALVIEGDNGKRIALLKTDNYLAQDLLVRRVAQILAAGDSGIGYDQILYHVTHNHSAAYSSTLSWGVWVFEDMFDARFFENQARRMAEAIELAAANMRPVAIGATTVRHDVYKGNVTRLARADDGTPAGYPLEYGDSGLVVLRVDDVTDPSSPQPLAIWVNWGEHPESLDGMNLHSADFLGPLERFVERETGAPLIYAQGDVGSAENSGNRCQLLDADGKVVLDTTVALGGNGEPQCGPAPQGIGVWRDWNHAGFVQTELNVRYLADSIIGAWRTLGAGGGAVPLATSSVVDYRNAMVPGPVSHPYPSVSNCNTDTTLGGDIGIPVLGLPDCFRVGETPVAPVLIPVLAVLESLRGHGLPIPEHYDFLSFTAIEENLRIRLQAFRIGEILLASCACEAQVDLILNLESRLDAHAANIYDGFDWACYVEPFASDPAFASACAVQQQHFDTSRTPTPVPGDNFDPAAIAHMRAQIHNDARGWDALENALAVIEEPADPALIWGNFTKEEIQDLGVAGYALPVGVGHAGDYTGYTVSYREYMNRDHYRKALTAYGPHTADYMVTRLVRMAAAMKGGPELAPEPLDLLAEADELRMQAFATTVGAATAAAYDAYNALLHPDLGPPAALLQPREEMAKFHAATFTWRGGSNAIDNPVVTVERETAPGVWQVFADQTGEVQTRMYFPSGITGVIDTLLGTYEWKWTASFEAYDAFPARLGSTPEGNYRFHVRGRARGLLATQDYELRSAPFRVRAWNHLKLQQLASRRGTVAVRVRPIVYPSSYRSPLPYVNGDDAEARICERCTFRPWARVGEVARVVIDVRRANGALERVRAQPQAGRWIAPVDLQAGDRAVARVFDTYGNAGTLQLAAD